MENFKFTLISIIIILVLGIVGYWAIFTIEPGSTHVDKQRQKELEETNLALVKEVEELKNELRQLKGEDEEVTQTPPVTTPRETSGGEFEGITPAPSTSSSSKHATLIAELEKLVADKIYMKEKSRGTRVGTIQTFLNIYNNTTKRVDNDYGKTTKADVAAFQKAVGLTADGETGPATYQKMIDWLKKQ